MNLTIFDLDNTLLEGDSDYAWGQFMVARGIVDAAEYTWENDRFYQQYRDKTLDIVEYQRFVLTPLLRLGYNQRQQLHNEFLAEVIATMHLPQADRLIQKHRNQGDELMIITATNRFIAAPIARWLGINTLLATEPEIVDNRLTGSIVGTPCFQEGKITRLRQWLQENHRQPEFITFYSDSINDLPLLKYADRPVAVDPDADLKAHADAAGWPVISLRESVNKP